MAGDWIKIKTDLATDPAVIGIAAKVGLDEDLVVGKLCRFWSWANTHTEDGHAPSVTPAWLDQYLGVVDIAAALQSVGWLNVVDDGLDIPKFDRHNGKSAKTRANSRERKIRERNVSRTERDKCHAPSVTEACHTPAALSRTERDRSVTETGLAPISAVIASLSRTERDKCHAPSVTEACHTPAREEKRREETTPPPNPPSAVLAGHAVTNPCPAAWQGVEGGLIELGVFAPRPAIESARSAGATPEDVLAVLHWSEAKPGAWGPGAIRNRVMICRPGLDAAAGWPEPSTDYNRQRQADSEGENRKRSRAKQAGEEIRNAETKLAAVEQEQAWGPVLDQLKPDELDQLADTVLGQTGPAVVHYRRHGASGMVRGLLLDAIAQGARHEVEATK